MTLRVAKESPGLLVVSERPLLMPGFCLLFIIAGLHALVGEIAAGTLAANNDAFGIAVALGLGSIGFLYSARYTSYRFEGYSGMLHWRRWQLWRRSSGVIPLATITKVRVERGPDHDDGMARIVLETERGDFPLANAYTANAPHQRDIAARIRAVPGMPAEQGSATPAAE